MSTDRLVRVIQCADFVTQSERDAVQLLKSQLINRGGDEHWNLICNYLSSSAPQLQSDEIDVVVVGPPGIKLVEVKFWDKIYVQGANHQLVVEHEAEKLARKNRRLAGKLKRLLRFDFGFIPGRFFLNKSRADRFTTGAARLSVQGIPFYGVSEWADLLDIGSESRLSASQIEEVTRQLLPAAEVQLGGKIRSFERYVDLSPVEELSSTSQMVYRARRSPKRDKVFLYLYDLSASDYPDKSNCAEREFETMQLLQKSRWLPRICDSFQEAQSYPGELYFFSVFDSEAPSIQERAADDTWSAEQRLSTAGRCCLALDEIHRSLEEKGSDQKHST